MKRISLGTWFLGPLLVLQPLVALRAAEKAGGNPGKAAVGQLVSDFVLTDATGKDSKLSELLRSGPKGENRPIVLFFYCTFCAPCRTEEASFD